MRVRIDSPSVWVALVLIADLCAFSVSLFLLGRLSFDFPGHALTIPVASLDFVLIASALVWTYAMGLYRVESLTTQDITAPLLAAFLLAALCIAALYYVTDLPELIGSRLLGVLPLAFAMMFVGRLVLSQLTRLNAEHLHLERGKRQIPLDALIQTERMRFVPARSFLSCGLKRIIDVLLTAALLVFTLPVMLVAMAAIVIEDGRPIFYRQERVGLNGRVFWLYKFRSMRCTAEADGVARWAERNDDRVTKVGRFLRRSRIDELPQFVNVLLGDMSLVGPRPERPAIVVRLEEAIPNYGFRHLVPPGITGWAQINYPYGASILDAREKTMYDFYYLKHGSIILDIVILLQTARVILMGEGAR